MLLFEVCIKYNVHRLALFCVAFHYIHPKMANVVSSTNVDRSTNFALLIHGVYLSCKIGMQNNGLFILHPTIEYVLSLIGTTCEKFAEYHLKINLGLSLPIPINMSREVCFLIRFCICLIVDATCVSLCKSNP